MTKRKFKDLSVEELEKKQKGLKIATGLFGVLVVALLGFVVRDFLADELEWSIFTIAICSLAGPVLLYSDLKEARAELKARRQ